MTCTAKINTSLSGAQMLVSCLEAAKIKRTYSIAGTSSIAFVNALYDKLDEIRYISTRHEQVADTEGRPIGWPGRTRKARQAFIHER